MTRLQRWGESVEHLLVAAQRPLSWTLLVVAFVLDLLAWLHVIAKKEPPVVLHLSTWAIIYSAYTAVLVAERNR